MQDLALSGSRDALATERWCGWFLAMLVALPAAGQNEVTGFRLIDADADTAIRVLAEGDTVDLTALPTRNLNVRADVASPEAGTQSVVFSLTGATTRSQTESAAPYALAGDNGGNYNAVQFNTGAHTLTATPYSEDAAGGEAGTAMTIHFTMAEQTQTAPSVALTSPPNGTTAEPPADFTVAAAASDPDGQVAQVEFFTGNTSLAVDTTDPYSISWNDVGEGSYTLTAVATDNDGNSTVSDPVTVHVATPGAGGTITGELKKWHKVTITFDGPATSETANPNPFLDYRLDVTFTGPGGQQYVAPGYYAADGNAANTGASAGNKWRVHLAPDEVGQWAYTTVFVTGQNVAVDDSVTGVPTSFHGAGDTFSVAATDKTGRDFRGKGMLQYVGGHYLRFAQTGEYFLKQGADAPENFLAYQEFDGPFKTDGNKDNLVKSWADHVQDWNPGDPTWAQVDGTGGTYGKGIVGAINYLASEGMNAFSFLPMNIEGDDRNVFPYLDYSERTRLDVSRLAQWEILFEHADKLGMFLHFKTQETENELLLDGGDLGPQRTLYYRELIARFGHHLALNWNLGEEINNATTAQKVAWAKYFHDVDPYDHHIVIHNMGDPHHDLLGAASELTGFSLQTKKSNFSQVHSRVKDYLTRSVDAGKPWAVACDEPGDASHALRPDDDAGSSHTDGRKNALWGTFLAGGWGNEWYFGYQHDHSDLTCQDFRSRDAWWDYCRHALEFFEKAGVPYWEMINDNNRSSAADDYCFFTPGEAYIVYLKNGGTTDLDLTGQGGSFRVQWYDPRNGGDLQDGTVTEVAGGDSVSLGHAPEQTTQDWAILVTRAKRVAYIHGDVAADGTVPSGAADPYHRMLLTDTGARGCSMFAAIVQAEGYRIDQYYDRETTLDAAFLATFDAVIFGLHQKIWSTAEKTALDAWLRAGGGMLVYSDSAAGGHYGTVGAQNPVGQTVVNNLISQYGMEVCVDQANGVKAYRAGPGADHPIVTGRPVLEGEGVSPVAVDPNGDAVRLIPYEDDPDYKVSGTPSIPHQQNLSIPNPQFAALAAATPGNGRVVALFDRQPLWNDGEGSDIEERDNAEILRRIVNYLADAGQAAGTVTAAIDATPTSGEVPLLVQFNGANSFSSAGEIESYEWDFDGDGATDSTEAAASHTYTQTGVYTARLTVTDTGGATDTAAATIAATSQEPFGNDGAPWPVPGRIEAENFDSGGEGVAYQDSEAANQGGAHRPQEAVDIQNTGDVDGQYNVGWMDTGEWLEYTVEIAETGTHTLEFRVASKSAGGAMRCLVDGVDKTGNVAFAATGNWQTYTTVTPPPVSLEAGQHVIRVEVVAGGFNFNWFQLARRRVEFTEYIGNYPTLVGPDADTTADPDGDGIGNLLEQWLALDPTEPDPAPLQLAIDNDRARVSFSYDSAVGGSRLLYEATTDLGAQWEIQIIRPEWVMAEGDLRHVAAEHDMTQQQRFFRLRVEP